MRNAEETAKLREDALAAWRAALAAVDPEAAVRRAIAVRPDLHSSAGRTLVLAVGKAAAGMLRGAFAARVLRCGEHADRDQAAPGPSCLSTLLLPHGSEPGAMPACTLLLRGGHPHPTIDGMAATQKILDEVSRLGEGSRLLVLLSGGASALLEAPPEGLSVEDLVASHRALVASGLEIAQVNLVRGCLSAVKAGRLAERAWPARVATLAISDVEGDDPAVIGSGPTVRPRRSRAQACADALDVVRAGRVALPPAALAVLERGASASPAPSASAVAGDAGPATGDPAPPVVCDFTVVASISDAVAAATAELERRGYRVRSGREAGAAYLRGDTGAAASLVAGAVERLERERGELGACAAVLGGETTVAVRGADPGRGGRSLDLAGRLALAIDGRAGVVALAAGTDGVDGSSSAAGAVVDGGTAARARAAGLELRAALAAFDTEPALAAAGDLLVTGPTGTNVGDLVLALARAS